jgi:hypothetical protein
MTSMLKKTQLLLKLALMKIHDMNKLFDSKVKCKLDDSIVCKTGIEVK